MPDAATIQLRVNAGPASGALEVLRARIEAGSAAMAAMQARLEVPMRSATFRDLAEDVSEAKAQVVALGGALPDMASSAQAAASGEQAVGDAATDAAAAARDSADALRDNAAASQEVGSSAGGASLPLGAMAKASKMLGGEFGGVASKALRLTSAFMKMGPAAAIAIAALAAIAGIVAGLVAVFMKGVEAAGALRDEFLKLQGAAKGSAAVATQLQEAITAVSSASALSRDKVTDYALQLQKAGLAGAELKRALEAMAIAGSAGGEEAASAFLKSAQAAKAAGQSVDALSSKMKTELGGVAAKQALSLNAQWEKFKENILAIFSGANIEPLLKGIRTLLSLFDQTSASGKSLKATVTAFVEAAIGAFLRFALTMVKAYIAIKRNETAMVALKVVLYAVLVVFALLGVVAVIALIAIAAAVAVIFLPIFLLIAAVVGIYMAFKAAYNRIKSITWEDIGRLIVYALMLPFAPLILLYLAGKALWNKLKSINWSDVGTSIKNAFISALAFMVTLPARLVSIGADLIKGLVNGIMAAGPAVLNALKGIVTGAIGAVKSLLGISSPSRVFAVMGKQTSQGMAVGVDAGSDDVEASARSMAGAAVKGASSKGAGKGGGHTLTFTNCVFGEGTSKSSVEQWFREALERAGGAVEVPT